MTKEPSIAERIEQAKTTRRITGGGELEPHFTFTESELHSLLQAYAKEQREICQLIFDSLVDGTTEDGEHLTHSAINGVSERIRNAPSPLKSEER